MGASWSILSPAAAPGAIGVVQLIASSEGELDAMLERTGIGRVPIGAARLRPLMGIDTGIVARWTPVLCHLMPHGGVAVVRGVCRRLSDVGVAEGREINPVEQFPEAGSLVEARMLAAIACAASPLAIDLLLDQPRRWEHGAGHDAELDQILNRLIQPPLVVAKGPPNIGKSTLINALAGRAVSIVADEPGTTRDHIGVMLDLGGLVVRYLDTPGVRAIDDPIESQAQDLSRHASKHSDLVLLMGDARSEPVASRGPALSVALRADLGTAAWPHDVSVSVREGKGLEALVEAIRERLVPRSALLDTRAWKFWKG